MTNEPPGQTPSAQPSGVSRRTAVLLCVASATAGAIGAIGVSRLLRRPPQTYAWSDIASAMLPIEPAGWPALGKLCETAMAERNHPLWSMPALAGFECSSAGVVTPEGLPAVRAAFEDCVAQEFGEGRVIVVDRWVLSETQAELCALAGRSGAGES